MTRDPLLAVSTRSTVQTERADARQVKNNAGGHTFEVTLKSRIERFLILGTDGGTYYVRERELTRENAGVIFQVIAAGRGKWLVDLIVEISESGRAAKQQPGLFALAAVASHGNDEERAAALAVVSRVCRTGFTLITFVRYAENMRGWGRGMRRAVASWFLTPEVDKVAYQVCKYRQRDGWAMRDLLRVSHPKTTDMARSALFHWIVKGEPKLSVMNGAAYALPPSLVRAHIRAMESTDVGEWVDLIEDHPLSWEMLPDAALTAPQVWAALVRRGLPMTALMRNLPRLTRLNVFNDAGLLGAVVDQLTDREQLRKARIHPLQVLVALSTYQSGRSFRGKGTWTPDRRIVDALDSAFYRSFRTIVPAGKRFLVALDVSASMTWETVMDSPLTPRDVSAAMALALVASEPQADIAAFASSGYGWGRSRDAADVSGLMELNISPRQRLDDVVRAIGSLPAGGTDCSLPMRWARHHARDYDAFIVFTDNETWAGPIHTHQALAQYRRARVANAKMVVCGMTATNFTIADPSDAGSLDVVGIDANVPSVISDFVRS